MCILEVLNEAMSQILKQKCPKTFLVADRRLAMPITQPPSPELAARAAALTHLPTNLSIKTQKPPQPFVGFAAGPALAAVQDKEELASKAAPGSGEWTGEESENAFWEEGAVLELASYDESPTPFAGKTPAIAPQQKKPSCKSCHKPEDFVIDEIA